MGFEKDKKYVVFGYLDKEGKLRTSMCAPNIMINFKNDLKRILKYSNWLKKLQPTSVKRK